MNQLPILIRVVLVCCWFLAANAWAEQKDQTYYNYPTPQPLASEQANLLMSPRSSLEYFIEQAKAKEYANAAKVLHTGLLPEQANVETIAKQLYVLVDKQLMFDWEELSELPEAPITDSQSSVPRATRSFELDALMLNDRHVTIYLQRYQLPESERPVWLFAPQSVIKVSALYKKYQPSDFEKEIPSWAAQRYGYLPLWQWLTLPLLISISYVCARILKSFLIRLLRRCLRPSIYAYTPALHSPLQLLLTISLMKLLTGLILSLSGPILTITQATYTIGFILTIFWFFTRSFNMYVDKLQNRFILDDQGNQKELDTLDDVEHKSQLTYISVLRRTVIFVAVIITLYMLMGSFNLFQGFGSALITSVGVLSIVLGIAAQATLGNIIAGLQIAIAKPVRIGDALSYNNTWCYCEDITYTYLTLKVWDDRRIIVPLKEFISSSFENWSLKDSHLLQPLNIYVDFTIDIALLRAKFEELLNAHELFDERLKPSVHALENTERTLCVRFLCSAATPLDAWQLHCDMREALTRYIADLEGGRYLPRERELQIEPIRI